MVYYQAMLLSIKKLPQRLVMAFEIVTAVQTPFPLPDMSSPSRSFANLSFINSSSAIMWTKSSQPLSKFVIIQTSKCPKTSQITTQTMQSANQPESTQASSLSSIECSRSFIPSLERTSCLALHREGEGSLAQLLSSTVSDSGLVQVWQYVKESPLIGEKSGVLEGEEG